MAQNLNYEMESSFCGDDGCVRYGRYYKWDAATVACPSGWHLPTLEEFETLFTAVGGKKIAAKALKSTSGWNSGGNGTDNYSFLALPAGYRGYKGGFYSVGDRAYFWSSTEADSIFVYNMSLYSITGSAYLGNYNMVNGFSVRCLKD